MTAQLFACFLLILMGLVLENFLVDWTFWGLVCPPLEHSQGQIRCTHKCMLLVQSCVFVCAPIHAHTCAMQKSLKLQQDVQSLLQLVAQPVSHVLFIILKKHYLFSTGCFMERCKYSCFTGTPLLMPSQEYRCYIFHMVGYRIRQLLSTGLQYWLESELLAYKQDSSPFKVLGN